MLGEPQHARVVAEVGVAQLGVAVEPELAHHRVLERARQEVGEEVRAGLLLERGLRVLARQHVVAVRALEPRDVAEHLVERAVGAAVGVRHRHDVIALQHLPDGRRDQLGPVVQQRGQRLHLHIEPRARAIAWTWTASAPQATIVFIRGTPARR